MGIQSWRGKILYRRQYGSKIAADPSCCCVEEEECVPCPEDCEDCCQTYELTLANPFDWTSAVPIVVTLTANPWVECAWVGSETHFDANLSYTYMFTLSCEEDEDGCGQWKLAISGTGADDDDNWYNLEGSAYIGSGPCPPESGSWTLEPGPGAEPPDYEAEVSYECTE